MIVQMLGPFYDLNLALHVQHQWSNATRGPGSRIARGIVLWSMYRDQGVSLYVSGKTKSEMQQYFRECRARNAQAQAEAAERERRIAKDVTLATTAYEKKKQKKHHHQTLVPFGDVNVARGAPATFKRPGSMSVKQILASTTTTTKDTPALVLEYEQDHDKPKGRKRGRALKV